MKLLIFSIVLSLISFNTGDIDWLSKSGKKKLEKTISKVWKDKHILKEEIIISDEIQKKLGFRVKDQSLYKIIVDNQLQGYLFLDSRKSKFDHFEYMVLFNKSLKIKKVNILVYREDYGGEICSSTFLKQFIGKNNHSKIRLGYDIQGISGATISSRSTVTGVKNITKKATILQTEGYLY